MLEKIKGFIMQDSARVWSALAMIAVLVVVFSINDKIVTWAFMGVLYLVAMYEGARLYGIGVSLWSALLAVAVWVGVFFSLTPLLSGVVGACIAALFVVLDSSFIDGGDGFNSDGFKNLLLFIYPSLPFIAIFALYEYDMWYVVWLIVVVAIADIFAYYGGKKLGKTPLCAASPKKTIEGALCGICGAIIAGGIAGIGIFGNFYISAVASLVIAVISIIGDLFESSLKRRAGLKDSGSILPGHGGILDRIDAIMFAAPTMLLILSVLSMYRA
ncbi:phosphatidate cytidylyltransferase [Helicobacter saguini]|uniref:Phosphatidate cytidylyltransferase n=1 Tax=Helicobacter saguini TaxID=1548018 RepID=A0A347VUN0_9HELI|nr:phosphatidate cytidylyltransferase [Helicobacter saguini]MWV62768.1 phosphatidate cytidylyltransferase [Helicobacter saguini]MWV66562.1 phosphatidate cytidylyltransferase [Helicobacter saguini]MWV68912.1 phosphatidate cytidylyltransferase [Helicobacter saguini]MWV71534.1 phosphatidate cytidylyltransferase [Helicobacter saguini]TLD93631.1 phosphatidate cytidylyltransferase [Helicobacter saguini]